jgi:hypothetical protein
VGHSQVGGEALRTLVVDENSTVWLALPLPKLYAFN